MAGISFAGILVAGTLLAIVEVGSVANLFETGYGQLLLLKIALVGLLLFLAGYNRYLLLPGLFSAAAAGARPDGAGPGLAAARLDGAAGGARHGRRPRRDGRAGQRDAEQRRQLRRRPCRSPRPSRSTADT